MFRDKKLVLETLIDDAVQEKMRRKTNTHLYYILFKITQHSYHKDLFGVKEDAQYGSLL